MVSADPNTIGVQGWAGLFGPTFQGVLVLDINGTEHRFVSSPSEVVDITSLMPTDPGPQRVHIAARIENNGGLASRGIAIVAGPPSTGAFIGERFVTGDGLGHRITMRFRVSAPDGTTVRRDRQGVVSRERRRLLERLGRWRDRRRHP